MDSNGHEWGATDSRRREGMWILQGSRVETRVMIAGQGVWCSQEFPYLEFDAAVLVNPRLDRARTGTIPALNRPTLACDNEGCDQASLPRRGTGARDTGWME